ncbi:DUF2269 family protein [Paenibacillus sp. CMAA1364]
MSWLSLLVLIHVLSAIIGVGPTFFGHYLLRKNQNLSQLRASLSVINAVNLFPKIGGSIALLSGITLILVTDTYGDFMVLWQFGSLIDYFIIQFIAIALLAPATAKLTVLVFDPAYDQNTKLNNEQILSLKKSSNLSYIASFFGIILFIFMILKPIVF